MNKGLLLCVLLLVVTLPLRGQESNEQMASYYYQQGEYDKAIELYEPLYERSHNAYYYQMLYGCYVATGQLRQAERLVEKRLKRFPKELGLYVDLGNLHLKQGSRKRAEKAYEEALNRVSYDSRQAGDLALAFESAGRLDLAIATYEASRTKSRSKFVYVMELATLHKKQGDYERMMDEYFNLMDNAPGNLGSIQIALQRALNETSDAALATGLRKTLIARIRQQPDNQQYLEMMIWFSLQQKDFEFALTQAQAVDARFAEQGAEQVLRVAQIARNNEAYDVAEAAYKHLIGKGKEHRMYFESRVGLLDVEYLRLNQQHAIDAKQLEKIETDYEQALTELGKNEQTIPLMRNYAHLLAYNGPVADPKRLQRASDLLYDIIEMPRAPKPVISEVKLELGDLLLFSGEIWDASLLYSQVEKANKNDAIGAMAKYKNARLSYYNNDFDWAKTQLDVLRASTTKLIANDAMELSLLISDNMEEDSTYDMLSLYAAADLMVYRGQLDSAWALLDDINRRNLSHALFDEVLMQRAKIRMKQGRYQEADSLLQFIVDHYGEDLLADDALFMLGELNEQQLGNPEKARQCYEKLLLDYPVSLYVDRARKRYNALKKG